LADSRLAKRIFWISWFWQRVEDRKEKRKKSSEMKKKQERDGKKHGKK
jgi:hypothetical protein